jgi:haloalkane dehalogenase
MTTYKYATVRGRKMFYREAGNSAAPTIVLLHGFPSSSHMFRDLIPKLSDRLHVIAPDYIGFGYSDAPNTKEFKYTFDNLAAHVEELVFRVLGLKKFSIYVQDYGAPIGYRIASKHQDAIDGIVVQNGNAYVEGIGPAFDPMKPFWADRNAETEKPVRGLLTKETTVFQYTHGVKDPERISPDAYTFDQFFLDRPGNDAIQLDLLYNYQSNVALYDGWHEYFRTEQPRMLIVWGTNDPFFTVEGAKAYQQDIPKAELHFLDTGHFALETHVVEIAAAMKDFLATNDVREPSAKGRSQEMTSSPKQKSTSAAFPYEKQKRRVLGHEMAYVELGEGDPIVLLHGNPTSSYLWRNVLPHLQSLGRCIAPDLIGMGDSDKLPNSGPGSYRFVEHRRYLDALLKVLDVRERVTFVIHDWGSALGFDWANRHREAVKGIAFMEAIVRPQGWDHWDKINMRPALQALRSEAGEEMVLRDNFFIEKILPGAILRTLSAEEMAQYRRPFAEPGEGRRPTLTWPRQIPIDGEPHDVAGIVAASADWLAKSHVPKLFFRAEPGAILANDKDLAFIRGLPALTEAKVAGRHYVQEDSPDEIGRVIASWIGTLG